MDKIRARMCNKLPGSKARKVKVITVIRRDFFQQVFAEEKVMERKPKLPADGPNIEQPCHFNSRGNAIAHSLCGLLAALEVNQ